MGKMTACHRYVIDVTGIDPLSSGGGGVGGSSASMSSCFWTC